MRVIRFRTLVGIFAVLLIAAAAQAQMPVYNEAGPVPPAIASAKSIFVANAGSDVGLFPHPFTGDEDRGYTEFYAALKATGDFVMAGDRSQADLVLELRLTAPKGPSIPDKSAGQADPLPQFKLVIYDRKTHYVLWTITQPILGADSQKVHDKTFDEALATVLRQFLQLAGRTPVAAGRAPAAH